MILIEKTQVMGLEPTIRGMRNPMNSWAKSDSGIGCDSNQCSKCDFKPDWCGNTPQQIIGPSDLDLMLRLARAGSVDGKFRRMIAVYVDITAPLYWWKEFDTYRVGVTPNPTDIEMNSCSTMHKIQAKEFTLDDFSHEHLEGALRYEDEPEKVYANYGSPFWLLQATIEILNEWRKLFNDGGIHLWEGKERQFESHDKDAWWQMIQLLPSTYNQKRTVMLNYEVLANIYQHRRSHKLDEWRELCRWIEGLPYSEIITCNVTEKDKTNALTAAIAKLRSEQWTEEEIVNLLLGQTKKEQIKLFVDGKDTTPAHGGTFDIPAVMADGTKNY